MRSYLVSVKNGTPKARINRLRTAISGIVQGQVTRHARLQERNGSIRYGVEFSGASLTNMGFVIILPQNHDEWIIDALSSLDHASAVQQ